MTIVKITRLRVCLIGMASCVLLGCADFARADLGDDRINDNATHQTIRNSNADVARGGPLHLYGWSSEHEEERRNEKRREKSRSLNHVPTTGDR